MDILYVVMPAYNEEDNILDVITSWYPVLEGKDPASRLVVADSGSTDRTHDLLEHFKKDHPQLEILSDTGKQHGPMVIALYDYSIKTGLILFSRRIRTDRLCLRNLIPFGRCVTDTRASSDTVPSEETASQEHLLRR